MENQELNFIITGKDANIAVEEIQKIIKEELDVEASIKAQTKAENPDDKKSVELLAIAAFVLAIPGSVLAVMQIIDRIKKKKQIDKALDRIQKEVVHKKQVSVSIQFKDGIIKNIESTTSSEIIESHNK